MLLFDLKRATCWLLRHHLKFLEILAIDFILRSFKASCLYRYAEHACIFFPIVAELGEKKEEALEDNEDIPMIELYNHTYLTLHVSL